MELRILITEYLIQSSFLKNGRFKIKRYICIIIHLNVKYSQPVTKMLMPKYGYQHILVIFEHFVTSLAPMGYL